MDVTIPSKGSSEKLPENTLCNKTDVYEIELNNAEDLLLDAEQGNQPHILRSESEEEFTKGKIIEATHLSSGPYFDSIREKTGIGCVVIDVTEKSHLKIENWLNDDPYSESDVLKSNSDEEIKQEVSQNSVDFKGMEITSCVDSNANINSIVNGVLEKLLVSVEDMLSSVEQRDELPESDQAIEFQENSLEEVQTTSQTYFDAVEEPAELNSHYEESRVEDTTVELIAVNPLPDVISVDDLESQDASEFPESLLVESSDTDEELSSAAHPSEEIGDRDELDDMDDLDDLDFVERMRINDPDELILPRPHQSDILQSSDPELQDSVNSLSDSEDDVFVDVENGGEYEIMDNLDFMQRMMFFFREADTLIRTSHGSGDHPWIEPEEEEAE